MKIVIIGAGALGASFGARLAQTGQDVTLVDIWAAHVDAINRDGLHADGVPSPVHIKLPAYLPDAAPTGFDMAFVATDTNATDEAAALAARVLKPDGFVLTVQNGIGNLEKLEAAVGRGRLLGGSTMCSFRAVEPGRVEQTHVGPTTIGELDGKKTPRLEAARKALTDAGYEIIVAEDIIAVIWTKFVLNCAVNALCATTGLRSGEIARLEAMDRFQSLVMDEAFAVVRAKGIDVGEAVLRRKIKDQCWYKYNRPSMLQHVEAGRRTEIDALNGALVREGEAAGVATPYNAALVMLLKGRERAQIQTLHEPPRDYAALEAKAESEQQPAWRTGAAGSAA